MQISKYAIINKIQLLAATIYDEDAAKEQKLTIVTEFSSITLLSEFVARIAVPKINIEDTLETVTVNLYQFFNIIDVCDDLIDLSVESGELLVRSYYNQSEETYEMAVKIPLLDAFVLQSQGELIDTVNFTQLHLNAIKNEFHNFKSMNGFHVVSDGTSAKFQYNERGISSELILDDVTVDAPFNQFISFRTLEILLGAGSGLGGYNIKFYQDGIALDGGEDELSLEVTGNSMQVMPVFTPIPELVKLFAFDTDTFLALLDLSTRITKASPDTKFVLKSSSADELITITSNVDGEMPLHSDLVMGVTDPIDYEIAFEPQILFNILKTTGIKYIALYSDPVSGNLVFDYKNAVLSKKLIFDLNKWGVN